MASQRGRIESQSSDSEEEYHVYRLRIHDATKDDAGVWKCEVEDKYGAVSTQCDINIWEEIQRKAALAIRQASMNEEQKAASKDQTLSLARKVMQNGTAEGDDTYIKKFMDRNALSEEEPNFVQSLRSTKVEEGRDFRLTCYVSGNPTPEVKWFKNNIELVNDHRHRIVSYPDGMNFLEIKRASMNLDSKTYRCEATSCLGISSTDARITVLDSKAFEEWDQHRGEYEMNIASIQKQSRTEAVKKVQIDDSSVSDRVLKRLKSEERSLHDLYSKQRESVLKLNCRWEDCQQFFFKEDLKSKCLVDGAGLTLSCFVSGISPFFVMWYKDGKPLFSNVYERYHIRARGGHLSLEIPCTTLDDTGEYSCEVRNEQGHIVSTCYVQVEPYNDTYMDYSRPYFAKNVHTVRIEYGGSATFSCICKGNPKPGLTWFKDGRSLNPSNKITMHSGEKGLNLLKIHDADYTDIGLYKCEAHNMAGRCQSSAKLLVFGEPTPAYKKISFEEEEFNRNQTDNFNVAVFEGEDMFFSKDSKDIFVKPPGFARSMPETMKVKEGQMIFFDCRAEGFPRPTGQWFFNDQPIQENRYIRIIGVKNIHTLEIKTAEASRDAGRYTLKLKNEATGQTCYSSCDLTIVTKTTTEEVTEDRTTRNAKFAESMKSRHIKDEEFMTVKKSVVSESVNECAEKVVAAAVAEASTVVAGGQGKDSVDGVAQSKGKDQVVEEVMNAAKEKPYESAAKKEPLQAVKEVPAEEAPVETAKEAPVEAAKEAPVESAKEAPVEAAKEAPVEAGKESPAEAPKSEEAVCATEEKETGSPVFVETIEPEYNFVDKEVNVKLKCQVNGDPMPLVVWWKDGVQLSSRGNIFIEWNWDTGVGALVFRSLSTNDSGKYECVASSKAGSCIANTVVNVKKQETAPSVAKSLDKEYNFMETDKNKRLSCKWNGQPVPTVEWFKDGTKLSANDRLSMEWGTATGTASLVFKSLSVDDCGTYKCVATSSAGTANSETNITVKKLDMIPTATKSMDKEYYYVESESNVSLSCTWEGQPKPTVEWFKDGSKVSASDNVSMNWNADTGVASLVFKSLTVGDSGSYECVATSSVGTTKVGTKMTVKKPDVIPTATKSMDKEYNYVESESNVSLSCTWEGQPKPTVEWFKDGSKLSASDNVSMNWNADTGVASLVFKSLTVEDSGSYECVATSSAGTTKVGTKMAVKKPDRVPTATTGLNKEYNFVDSETNVKLSCTWDGQPMPTIEWFKDGTKLSASDNLSMEWNAETGVSALVFKTLSVDASGSYTCVATSSAGTETCETVVTVKKAEKIPTAVESLPSEYTFVDTDTNACLKCKWGGNPSPTVEWFKDGSKLSADDNLSMNWNAETGEASLKFKSLSKDASGNYECVATSPLGTTKANTNVVVKKPEKKPTVEKALDKEYNFADTDTNVKLQCQVDGNPCPEITWTKDGTPLANSDKVKCEWDEETGTAALVFASLTEKDSGKYECVAKSPLGTSTSPTTVSVTKPKKAPSVVKPLDKQYNLVETETHVRIQCQIDGNPAPEISWVKDDMEMEAGGRIKFEWNADTGMATLLLRKLSPMDAGKYECVATSSLGSTSSSTNVSINKPDKTPEVTQPLKKEYNFLDTDEHVILECQIDGSPAPEITWLKDGQPVEAGGKFKLDFEPENGLAELVFSHLSPDDSGTYECVAKSRVGETKCATTVTVTKPEREPSILQPMDRDYNFFEGDVNICLQCMMEGNPTPDVAWFKGGKKVEPSDNLSVEWDAESGVASLTFKKVSCDDSGHYECVASSKLGTSRCPTTVNVKKPEWKPVIEGLNKDYTFVDTDTNVQIQCKVSANPAPKVEWRKNGRTLADCENISTQWNADSGTAVLTFKSLTCDDSGEYECEASSDLGTTMVATNVEIKKPEKMPAVLKPLEKHYRFEEGEENVVISCTFEGNPPPKIAWTQNGKKLKNADYARFEFDPETGVAAIVFTEPLSTLDTGTYECVATSHKGACKTKTEINVSKKEDFSPTEPMRKPNILKPLDPEYIFASSEKNARIQCKIDGNPAPAVYWQKNGEKLLEERNLIFEWNEYTGNAALIFKKISKKDSGSYHCVGYSNIGSVKTHTHVKLEQSAEEVVTAESAAPAESAPSKDTTGPPVFTDMAMSQTVPIGGSAVFKCIVISQVAAEFTWQKDSVNIKSSERVIISITDKETSLTINDVQMSDRGTYTCVAKNQYGTSETSGDLLVDEKENLLRGKRRQTWAGEFSSVGDDDETSGKGRVEGDIMTIDETDGSADTKDIPIIEESVAMATALEAQTAGTTESQKSVSMVEEQQSTAESASVAKSGVSEETAEEVTVAKSATATETAKSVTFAAEESSSMKSEKISSSSQQTVTTVTESSEKSSLTSSKSRSAVESRTENLDSSDQGETTRGVTRRGIMKTKSSTVRVLEDFESSVTKLQETLSQTSVQKTRSQAGSSGIEILEVTAVPVARAAGSLTDAYRRHHEHHAPELIIPANSQRLPEHSEIELMVKVKASKHANVKWLHDGKPVNQTERYEMIEEEIELKK